MILRAMLLCLVFLTSSLPPAFAADQPAPRSIPWPEHPRPDFARSLWVNLNGPWSFRFDADDQGESDGWFSGGFPFQRTINVPFPWGSELSGVEDEAKIAWYARRITVPPEWRGRRVFRVIGACDWLTTAWLDGEPLGQHRGGYTPFEFELTPRARLGNEQLLVLRVDDSDHPFKLEGKQGYGPARGIWQTVYLEARGKVYLETLHFTPDIDARKVSVRAKLSDPLATGGVLGLSIKGGPSVTHQVPTGGQDLEFSVSLPDARLWSLEDPYLHEVEATLTAPPGSIDQVSAYFGMRRISVEKLPGTGHAYIALNGEPVYLQMTLDQAYHREGFYTYSSDEFVRDEILRSLRIGLNGMRIHVKIDMPRKLYWADRLGMLIMADVPNSWGDPDAEMRRESEVALRGMIRRDYNHPAIFSWVIFNETWGLDTKGRGYLPETQSWVSSMFDLARSLDPTRLVEDNSPHRGDHVVTDINSWHAYLPGHGWRERLDQITRDSFPGSQWNYVEGRAQGEQPVFNSECGNVWGYEGSTGDVDWSWDYHIMIDEFRRHPKICGWLYTEHHDVINEWNGYYRFDRSPKITGLAEIVDGMSLRDLHAPLYVAIGGELCREVEPRASIEVPLWASFLAGAAPRSGLVLRAELHGWDRLGRREVYSSSRRSIAFRPWTSEAIAPLAVEAPQKPCLAVLSIYLEDSLGSVISRNFTTFLVTDGPAPRDETLAVGDQRVRVLRVAPRDFTEAEWSLKSWQVLDGLKVNGAGAGHFTYEVPWPADLAPETIATAALRLEVSAKQLFGKDRDAAGKVEGDFMRGRGTFDPSLNSNSYPMTDTARFPSMLTVRAGGGPAMRVVGRQELKDDPADHRGILSWHSQKRDRRLREAGSYGDLLSVPLAPGVLEAAAAAGKLRLRLEVDEASSGGLAIYGARFGRYPLDPSVILTLRP